jgi:GAF domain-containing protein/DNA-binding CsgD family transcriptional regulator
MPRPAIGNLADAIYDAALDPAGWVDVMRLLRRRFRTGLEAFYFLDLDRHTMRQVHISGVTPFYVRTFSECFFTADNPCTRSEPLHRPGVVRTDERLARYFRDTEVLRRSQYFNDWMRPQKLGHTLGATLVSDGRTIANLSLLRSPDAGRFGAEEVASFAGLCGHLRRAVQIAMRVQTLTARGLTTCEALDHLPYGVAFLDRRGRLLHGNLAAEALLRRGEGLTLRQGRVVAAEGRDRATLDALLRAAAAVAASEDGRAPAHATIHRRQSDEPLSVSAVPLSARGSLFVAAEPTILLLVVDPTATPPPAGELIRQRYGLTAAETRLALALVAEGSLRRAAEAAGMTYETARWYVKILFQKTATGRQAALVARLVRDMAVPLGPRLVRPPAS